MKRFSVLLLSAIILVMTAGCGKNDQSLKAEPTVRPEDTPAGVIHDLFSSGDVALTLSLAGNGNWETYTAGEWYAERFQVLLNSYQWTKLEMPLTEPSDYWLTARSADGSITMTFWSDGGAGSVQYSAGNSTSCWKASAGKNGAGSIAEDIRMEYDNLDVDFSRVSFPLTGDAEAAANYFVHNAYAEHMTGLEPGSIYGIVDYEVADWAVREASSDGNACVGYFNYAFVPLDFNSPGIWAGNTSEGSGKYEGKLMCYREFVLQLQEDGNWHCTGLGTGGYTLPE